MRLILLSLGLVVGYVLCRAFAVRSRGAVSSPAAMAAALCIALCAALLMGAIEEAVAWAVFWRRDWFERFPLDATLVGLLAGAILADNRSSPSPARPPSPLPGAVQGRATGGTAGPAAAIPTILLAVALGVLLLLAAVPRTAWSSLVSRTQAVSASATGFSVSFSPAEARSIGQAIRAVARPLTPTQQHSDDVGFITSRLQVMESLVSPPDYRRLSGDVLSAADMFQTLHATRVILSGPDLAGPVKVGVSQSHFIARDRATFWMLHDRSDPDFASGLGKEVAAFASGQEMFLIALRRHVACLKQRVDATGDKRILEYRNFPLVEHITAIARSLMRLEFDTTLRSIDPGHPGLPAGVVADLVASLNQEVTALEVALQEFAGKTLAVARLRAADPTTRGAAAAACADAQVSLPDLASLWRDGKRGFAPYVPIFAAYLMSAIGDHAAATKLLADWIEQLNALERALPPDMRAFYGPMAAWLRLRVLTELYFVQRLSERSETAVPARIELMKYLAFEAFPAVLPGATRNLWQRGAGRGGTLPCRDPNEAWRQKIVLSYAQFAKDYLDYLVSNTALSGELNDADIRLARSLVGLDLECFPGIFATYAARVEQRAQFVSTFAIVTAAWGQVPAGREAGGEVAKLQGEARLAIRESIADLERITSAQTPPAAETTERLVFGEPSRRVLETVRKVKQSLEE